MATQRARDAARQLKDDIKNSMHISSRSKERTTPDAPSKIISSGRIYFILIKKKLNHAYKACLFILICTFKIESIALDFTFIYIL
jgi:hypothetical protein